MNESLLMVGVFPLVIYVAISTWKHEKAGVIAAMISGVVALVASVVMEGAWDESMLLELGLIVLLGFISLRSANPLYFKLQPMFTAFCLAIFLAYFEWLGTPYLTVLAKRMGNLDPRIQIMIAQPEILARIDRLSFSMIFIFFIHGAACGLAATKLSNMGWMLVRLAIYPIFMIVMIYQLYF